MLNANEYNFVPILANVFFNLISKKLQVTVLVCLFVYMFANYVIHGLFSCTICCQFHGEITCMQSRTGCLSLNGTLKHG